MSGQYIWTIFFINLLVDEDDGPNEKCCEPISTSQFVTNRKYFPRQFHLYGKSGKKNIEAVLFKSLQSENAYYHEIYKTHKRKQELTFSNRKTYFEWV